MTELIIAFLALLNPFALFLYLSPVMKELSHWNFLVVLFKATLISFLIYLLFLFGGEYIFRNIFQIEFESFRIFGGIVIFSFAYLFVVKGQEALIEMKEDLDDLASEIALPFMVGAGTISLAIIMGHRLSYTEGVLSLTVALGINYAIIIFLMYFRRSLDRRKLKVAFDKHMQIFLRLSAFVVGAIGINMIIQGIRSSFFLV